MKENILVWEDGLDYMWNEGLGQWWDDPRRESNRFGPLWRPNSRKEPSDWNRGRVWLFSAIPVTSVKPHVLFYQSRLRPA
jgi:hypothetical protein